MDYPKTIPAFLEAARAYEPPVDISEAYYAAAFAGSPVEACIEIMRILIAVEALDEDGLNVLLGAAYLISLPKNQWQGMGGVAANILALRTPAVLP